MNFQWTKLCFIKSMQFIFCADKPELFIKLRLMAAGPANDAVNEFCEVPFHKNSLGFWFGVWSLGLLLVIGFVFLVFTVLRVRSQLQTPNPKLQTVYG
jgi:hypothetical protein